MRPGEKLYEEMFTPGETYRRTTHQKIFVIDSASNQVLPTRLNQMVSQLEDAVYGNRSEELVGLMRNLLPEFRAADDAPAQLDHLVDGELNLRQDTIQVTSDQMLKAV
jgi:FlaA1/EpsC-like NDP-sugar epimerase